MAGAPHLGRPAGSPAVRLLLSLPPGASTDEVGRCLTQEFQSWGQRPKLATATLKELALQKLPGTAEQVLHAMRTGRVEANVVHFNAVVSAYEKISLWQQALTLLRKMPSLRVAQDVVGVSSGISACAKSGLWQLALRLLGEMPEVKLGPDEICRDVSCNTAISACEKGGCWLLALALLRQMPAMRLRPDVISFNAAISSCEKGGRWREAIELLRDMARDRVLPDIVSFSAAISACDKGRRWQRALGILQEMVFAQVPPSKISCLDLLKAAMRPSALAPREVLDQELALELLRDEMPKRRVVRDAISNATTLPSPAARRAASGASASSCERPAGVRQVGLRADAVSFNAAMSSCEKAGQWQMAVQLLRQLPPLRVRADEIGYGAAIRACSSQGRWQLALGLVSEMAGVKLRPNEVCRNAAITGCERAGCWQPALAVLQLMPEQGSRPDVISFNAAISSCEKGGRWQEAMELLRSMAGVQVGVAHGNQLLRRHQRLREGSPLASGASASGGDAALQVVPDRVTCNAAISACEKGGQWQLATSLLEQMPRFPDEISFNSAITACQKYGPWSIALSFLQQMPEVGLTPNEMSYNAVVGAFLRSEDLAMGLLGLLGDVQERMLSLIRPL
ncbi:unnamed protein product [Polarella glacialis]|uniref:Pentatricopeptide repeat-containing protein, chloroplastic n=1 Tax=Polarella glacialis TaxID=89957 RepID=A0A813IT64_POLGL|nr:unnamed protein product [Polarella glacialis]